MLTPVLGMLTPVLGMLTPDPCLSPQLSMKEVGDGLQQQMNSMMGALQELKLLQLQTALEQLDLAGQRSPPEDTAWTQCWTGDTRTGDRWTQDTWTGHTQGRLRDAAPCPGRPQGTAGGWLLCQECPGCDDGHDWTSSLMSQSRNRQPLVLGDNVFADLVGNWLDLPELDKKGDRSEALSSSRSQELCRKFSLTANIFKKFLRSVRPDRERLLKEKPCWLPPEDKHISKRPKKISKLKGTFYLPLQSRASKAERGPRAESRGERPRAGTRDFGQAGFDINTAVWV
uniref:PAK4-inhibitor INKA2 n=1 Tax=Catharus ustulatus TaxID=91951 RepID=A0A8C3UTF6_CATUS